MIEFLPESTENILGVRFSAKLHPRDYRDVLAPRIDSLLERFTTLRVLILMDGHFEGWTLPAAWTNTTFDLKHRRDFDKIAMVGAPKWEEWCVRVPAAVVMNGKLRTYSRDRLNDAWDWIRA